MKKEIELKYLLASRSDFELFFEFIKPYANDAIEVFLQENYYFDTPNLDLKKSRLSLRLRRQNNDFVMSGKTSLVRKDMKHHLSVRLEYEGAVEPEIADLLIKNQASPIDAFGFLPVKTKEDMESQRSLLKLLRKASKTGLQMIGSFVNERTVVPFPLFGQTVYFEFDHSRFPKGNDSYEVELEFASEKDAATMHPMIDTLFYRAGIKTKTASSKSSRLYKILFNL